MTNRPLIAYAFLAQCAGQNSDIVNGLVHLVKPLIKNKTGELFSSKNLSNDLSEFYGIKIHPWAIENMALRLEKGGVLTRISKRANVHEYYYSEVEDHGDSFCEKDVREVTDAFVAYSRDILTLYKLEINEDRLKQDFLSELTKLDFIASILKPDRPQNKEISDNRLHLTAKRKSLEINEEEASISSEIAILCASFILNAYTNNPDLYERIYKITTGALIAEVILNYRNPDTGIKFFGLTIFVDAPFIISILGLSSEESNTYTKELCDQIRSQGAQLAAFPHTIDEVSEIIKSTVSAHSRGDAFGSMAARMNEGHFLKYVTSLVPPENLHSALARLYNLKITDPSTPTSYFAYFSDEAEQGLSSSIGHYENLTARVRDASSISKIIRLRKGKYVLCRDFQKCEYVFLTGNSRLAQMSTEFVTSKNLIDEKCVPPCITDRYLAGILWVLFGGEGNKLNIYRLLANCTSAIHPRDDVVSRMHMFLSKLDEIKANHFKALMTQERVAQYLITQTLGNSDLITENNVEQIYDKIALIAAEQVTIEKNKEILELKEKYEAEIHETKVNADANISSVTEQFSRQLNEMNERIELLANKQQTAEDETFTTKLELKRLQEENIIKNNETEQFLKNVVAKCIRIGERTRKRTRLTLIFVYLITLIIINILAMNIPEHFRQQYFLASILTPTLFITLNAFLSVIGAWFVPDYLFNKYVILREQKAIENEIKTLNIDALLNKHSVNWLTGEIHLR